MPTKDLICQIAVAVSVVVLALIIYVLIFHSDWIVAGPPR